jgi:PilZ domain
MSLARVDKRAADAPRTERRRHRRHDTFWRATLRTSNGALDCRVIDVSAEGTRVRVVTPTITAPVNANDKVMLTISGVGRVFAVVAWARGNAIGMRIVDALAMADWRAALEKRRRAPN